jgi:hypothetical protein
MVEIYYLKDLQDNSIPSSPQNPALKLTSEDLGSRTQEYGAFKTDKALKFRYYVTK